MGEIVCDYLEDVESTYWKGKSTNNFVLVTTCGDMNILICDCCNFSLTIEDKVHL